MSPKSQEKQKQQQQQLLNKHSEPFYISAHGLCHNKQLKLKRSRWLQLFNKMQERNKPDVTINSRKVIASVQNIETIDLLSDNDEDAVDSNNVVKNNISHQQQISQLTNTNGLSALNVTNNIANYINIPTIPTKAITLPPISPLAPANTLLLAPPSQHQPQIQQTSITLPRPALIQIPIKITPITNKSNIKTSSKRKSNKPRKHHQTPLKILDCSESIVLSDGEDDDNNDKSLTMNSSYLGNQNIPSKHQHHNPEKEQQQQQMMQTPNSIQVDEVTVSLVPRNFSSQNSPMTLRQSTCNINENIMEPFPRVPDETTVQTVIANRTYELSLTKLREGLASCGIPEFSENSPKTTIIKKKSTALPPQLIVTPPQQPISLKLSNDLSISLISDDDDDNDNQNDELTLGPLLSPTLLQKLPLNVSIAPVPKSWPTNKPPKRKLG